MPAGLKHDVNSTRSVELNNNGLIQKQPKISMLNTVKPRFNEPRFNEPRYNEDPVITNNI